MASEMVERVARAMVAAQFNEWDEIDGGDQSYFLNAARAAIEAMRTIDGQLLKAVDNLGIADDHYVARGRAYDAWTAIIDAALEEHP